MRRKGLTAAIALAAAMAGTPAQAQRAAENAVNAAEDAFGLSIGNETIGLYNANSARGFSPTLAGNVRMDGLYFDVPFFHLVQTYDRSTTRVGLSAQSYPFPAPTGIFDIGLRRPSKDFAGNGSIVVGPFDNVVLESAVEGPIVPGKLGGLATIRHSVGELSGGAHFIETIAGASLNWTPSDAVEVMMFNQGHQALPDVTPLIFTASGEPPPEFDRRVFFGQSWAPRRRTTNHAGVTVTAALSDDWNLRAGLFRARVNRRFEHFVFFRNVQADGTGTLDILRTPRNYDVSYSGEVRLRHTLVEGPRQHTFYAAVRARDMEHLFGGGSTLSFGAARIGVSDPRPEPIYPALGAARLDNIKQVTPGLSYVGRWRDVGEVSVGLQKSFYRRDVELAGAGLARTQSEPWLPNATLAIYLNDDAALYGSYTRGLEESGIAPENASNRGEALPASLTEQVDAGIRYRMFERLTVIAGLFEVKKPYFERNAANLFTHVGSLSHRGVELSLSGQIAPGLTVVAGAMLLRARIDAHAALAGFIGDVPVGRPNRNVRLNLQYGPKAWNGFSIDGQVSQDGPVYATRANTVRVKGDTSFDLGARYVFTVFDTSASLRARVLNLTNAYSWSVSASGAYTANQPRRYTLQLVADF